MFPPFFFQLNIRICVHPSHFSQAPNITVTAGSPAVEGNSGTTPATFTVQLSAASVSERAVCIYGPDLRGPCCPDAV
jgi:hypothetical protein